MKIILNGAEVVLKADNIAAMLTEQGYAGKIVAVAVNGTFVPKSRYSEMCLTAGDQIEIVAPMQGG